LLERLLLLFAFAMLMTAGILAGRARAVRRIRHLQSAPTSPLWEALGERADGRPAIILFSTSSCAVCRSAQIPALDMVRQKLGEPSIRIFNVDASRRPDLVKAFRIMTAPTTVVFTGDGRVSAYNHGFASTERMIQQLTTGSVVAVPRGR
jgi:thiol-disulfide isomerase/thioredoxin